MITKNSEDRKDYETPNGLQEDNYYEMMYDLMDYINEKGLTTRQAQHLFADCFDMVLDVKPTNEPIATDYLKSISDSLNKIAEKGIEIFNKTWRTN